MDERVKVLLIEDDPDSVYLVSLHLGEACGPDARYVLESSETLSDGLKRLSAHDYDVVLLDLMLPDSQGLSGLAALRAQAPDLPVVVMTNLNDEDVGMAAIAQGAQDFLVKGRIDAVALKRAIGYARERSRLLSQVEAIIDQSAEGMLVVERSGRILYLNAAATEFLGKKREELLGGPFGFPLRPGPRREIRCPGPGEERVGQLRVAALRWRKDDAFLASIQDITELRKVEQLKAEVKERRRVDELKDQFLSTVSHELRSPLTIIKAAVVNLWDGLAGPMTPPQTELVNIGVRNVERLSRIINNVLDISRLESGRAEVFRAAADLQRLAKEAVEGARLVNTQGKVRVGFEPCANAPKAYADPDMMSQVLHNLIDNAIRFAKSEVVVRLSMPEPERLQVTVADDGAGIPKDRLHELFDKFVQVNRPVGGSGYKGTGLGLAICREMLSLNEGRIWVESEPGEGTKFHFSVPRFAGKPAPSAVNGKASSSGN